MITIKESLFNSIGYRYNIYVDSEIDIYGNEYDFSIDDVIDEADINYNGKDLVKNLEIHRDNIKSDLGIDYMSIESDGDLYVYPDDCVQFFLTIDKELDKQTIINVFSKYIPKVVYDGSVDIEFDYDTGGYYDSSWGNWLPSSSAISASVNLLISLGEVNIEDDADIIDLSNGRN